MRMQEQKKVQVLDYKGIINSPIKLSIYSPDCPDLTIIDLPGITRIPLKDSD